MQPAEDAVFRCESFQTMLTYTYICIFICFIQVIEESQERLCKCICFAKWVPWSIAMPKMKEEIKTRQ